MIRCNHCNSMTPKASFESSLKFLISFARLPSTSTRNLINNNFPPLLFLASPFQMHLSRICPHLRRHHMNLREVQVFAPLYLPKLISCFLTPIVEPLKVQAFVSQLILIVSVKAFPFPRVVSSVMNSIFIFSEVIFTRFASFLLPFQVTFVV